MQNNHGFLFKNKYQEHLKQPSMQGTCKIDGKDYKIVAWTKMKKGDEYLSFSVEPVEEEFIPTEHENNLDDSVYHEQQF